jgi:hypothetical protein
MQCHIFTQIMTNHVVLVFYRARLTRLSQRSSQAESQGDDLKPNASCQHDMIGAGEKDEKGGFKNKMQIISLYNSL